MSRRYTVRRSPSWMRAKTWICSRISALEGRSSGLTLPRQRRLAALRLAVKYSDSTRSYISRAASSAIAWRSLALLILSRPRYKAHQCGAGLSGAEHTSIIPPPASRKTLESPSAAPHNPRPFPRVVTDRTALHSFGRDPAMPLTPDALLNFYLRD